jgi:hypothetical protein
MVRTNSLFGVVFVAIHSVNTTRVSLIHNLRITFFAAEHIPVVETKKQKYPHGIKNIIKLLVTPRVVCVGVEE